MLSQVITVDSSAYCFPSLNCAQQNECILLVDKNSILVDYIRRCCGGDVSSTRLLLQTPITVRYG